MGLSGVALSVCLLLHRPSVSQVQPPSKAVAEALQEAASATPTEKLVQA